MGIFGNGSSFLCSVNIFFQVFRKLGSHYGKIYTVYLGGQRTVILNDSDIIKDAFIRHHECFVDRPQDLFLIAELTKGLGRFDYVILVLQSAVKFV